MIEGFYVQVYTSPHIRMVSELNSEMLHTSALRYSEALLEWLFRFILSKPPSTGIFGEVIEDKTRSLRVSRYPRAPMCTISESNSKPGGEIAGEYNVFVHPEPAYSQRYLL